MLFLRIVGLQPCFLARAILESVPPGQAKVLRVAGEQGRRNDPFAGAGPLLGDMPSAGDPGEAAFDRVDELCGGGPVVLCVDVLGRYGFERDILPRHPPVNLRVTFRSVHGSKGLEANYIVIPGVTTGTYGLPSTIADDPVLDLPMPASTRRRSAMTACF